MTIKELQEELSNRPPVNTILLKKHVQPTTKKPITKEDVLNRIQSLRGKLSVIIEELDCLENDVKTMEE